MSETDTTDSISCPADECDYSGQSVPAVRAHVNSIGDPEHPMWGEIKDDIEDDIETESESESTENQTESIEDQERDTDSDSDSDSMPTTDEYEQQYSDDDTDDTDDDTNDAVSIPNLPMNPTTLLVLLVIGISLYLTYSMVGSSGTPTGQEATTSDTTPDIDGSTAAQSNDDIQQGLVG